MANNDAARGLTPVKYSSGRAYSGAARRYFKSATAGVLGVGDTVIRATNSSDPEGGPEVVKATVGAAITGVIVGLDPSRSDLSKRHLASADTGYLYVADDPDLLFACQEVNSGTALTVTQIGEHIDLITAADADTTTGRSVAELDNAAVATDNTFRLEELVRRADNAVGAAAEWLVSANLHTEANGSATRKTEI